MVEQPFVIPSRVQCLSATDIFCDLSTEEIHALSQRAPVRRVEPKTLIYTPHELTETLFMLNEGQIQLYDLSAEGKVVTNALLQPGTLFGEMRLLGQTLNGQFAQAVTNCVLCVMTVTDVQQLLLADLRISNRLVALLARRLLNTQRHLAVVTLKSVPNRVAWALLYLSEQSGKEELHITHEMLASLVAANRETVTKILNEFRAKGWIALKRGRIQIVKDTELSIFAEQ